MNVKNARTKTNQISVHLSIRLSNESNLPNNSRITIKKEEFTETNTPKPITTKENMNVKTQEQKPILISLQHVHYNIIQIKFTKKIQQHSHKRRTHRNCTIESCEIAESTQEKKDHTTKNIEYIVDTDEDIGTAWVNI
ncbi:hypothetical protein Pfo_013910 [Paulownia fortunei]|nr:hypothetical protein Pfo_013910 [Paulownia fortunei]